MSLKKSKMGHLVIFLLLFFTPIVTLAQPKHEVRAVWLTTIGGIDWPHTYANSASSADRQKQELKDILDRLKAVGINTVLLQTRIRATTIYPSAYEPFDACLSGKNNKSPGYDPLQFAIDECHARGMELHAWIVTIPIGKWNSSACQKLRKRLPDAVIRIGDEGFLNPEKDKTASYLADFCSEIVTNYDVDGIHLDYIRYPETWRKKTSKSQGRANITSIVRAISQRVKARKPWVKMSCSPVGKYDDLARYDSQGWNAYTTVCQDAQGWLHEGLMDELFPMMYFRGNQFFPFAIDWKENDNGRIVAPGLGIYFLSPKERNWALEDVTRELEVLRQQGMGHAYFRSKFLTDNVKGIYDYAKTFSGKSLSLVPPMTWEHSKPPKSPATIDRSKHLRGTELLTWQQVSRDTVMTMYNVYSSRSYPVDTKDARNLLLVRFRQNQIVIPSDSLRYYAVTTTDRYGNESAPVQEKINGMVVSNSTFGSLEETVLPNFLDCNGKRLQLPDKGSKLDADFVIIETIEGKVVNVLPYNSRSVDVSNLDDGIYVLRSLGKKGRNHRLGHFLIRRKF